MRHAAAAKAGDLRTKLSTPAVSNSGSPLQMKDLRVFARVRNEDLEHYNFAQLTR